MEDIAKTAENVIVNLEKDKWGNPFLKTNQIRKFLTAVNVVTNKVNMYKSKHLLEEKFPDELAEEVMYLKVKIAYQAGRERSVKQFVEKADLVQRIKAIGHDIKKYNDFARYVEALVAYHKFYGGKDK